MFASIDWASVSGIGLAIAALLTAAAGVRRGSKADLREDMEAMASSFRTLLEAERAFTGERITALEDKVTTLETEHYECEQARQLLLAELGRT